MEYYGWTDASYIEETKRATLGYIIKDDNDKLITHGYKIVNDCISSSHAELLGLYNVLKMLKHLKIKNAFVMSDESAVVSALKGNSTIKSLKTLVNEIREFLKENFKKKSISFVCIPRELNTTADRLASKRKIDLSATIVKEFKENVDLSDRSNPIVKLLKEKPVIKKKPIIKEIHSTEKSVVEGNFLIKSAAFKNFQKINPKRFKRCSNQRELCMNIIRMVEFGIREEKNGEIFIKYENLKLKLNNGYIIANIECSDERNVINERSEKESNIENEPLAKEGNYLIKIH
jgi:ribonuclease HI